MLEVHRESEWAALAAALGRRGWLADSRFSTPAQRLQHDAELAAELSGLFAKESAAAWEQMLVDRNVPAVRADEHTFPNFVVSQGLALSASHAYFGNYRRLCAKITFERRPSSLRAPAAIGEHNEKLLQEIGLGGGIACARNASDG